MQAEPRAQSDHGAALAPSTSSSFADRIPLQPALRDPFAAGHAIAVQPSPPAPKPIPLVAAPAPVPLPPAAPALNLRFVGRIATPDGRDIVYLSLSETSTAIAVGQVLGNGYRVEAITDDAVQLTYAPLNVSVRFPLPPPPTHEIR